ncbi:hypothetical protein TNCV_1692451 [Trichonephila clavipes]|nr:hypothetical protein TNCV_1692451 [Trichonephila clavipes]
MHKNVLSLDEIADFLQEFSENESDGSELSCSNLGSDEDIRLNESDCEESEESADVIDNIPENYVVRDDTKEIPHWSNVPGISATWNVFRQSSKT